MQLRDDSKIMRSPSTRVEDALAFFEGMETVRPEEVRSYVSYAYKYAIEAGVDPTVVVSHAANETDFFRSNWWRDRLNPAGMGITGWWKDDAASPTFDTGEQAARAHVAHMMLYATGTITSPLSSSDDPRYFAYIEKYGNQPTATVLKDLSGTWADDKETHIAIAKKSAEIFGKVDELEETESPPVDTSPKRSKLYFRQQLWDGRQSVRVNGILFNGQRGTVHVGVDKLNTRLYADHTSTLLDTLDYGTPINVLGWVRGTKVGTEDRWWIADDYSRIWVGGTAEKPR